MIADVTPLTREELAVRLRKGGLTQNATAAIVGVSPNTIRRWTDPVYAERQRRLSREAKQRRTGTCIDCGGETRYDGHGRVPALRCASCGSARATEMNQAKRCTGPTQAKVLEALAERPHRFTELRDIVGYPSNQVNSALNRMLRYGCIVRPERGLYALPEDRD